MLDKILLNDLFHLDKDVIDRTRVRLIIKSGHLKESFENTLSSPMYVYEQEKDHGLLDDLYWNYSKRSFKDKNIVIGLARTGDDNARKDLWLLFHIGEVTRDLELTKSVGYEHRTLPQYGKFVNRVIVSFHNKGTGAATLIRKAANIFPLLEVHRVTPGVYMDDGFPGYMNVRESWHSLKIKLSYISWQTALSNQKGVYLITDRSNGKQYVGSATGDERLLQRWQDYVGNSLTGGNAKLRHLGNEYIRNNFQYSILECFPTSTPDDFILERESWWKETLCTRGEYGYNAN